MANRRGTQVPFDDKDPQATLIGALPQVQRSTGEDAAAAVAAFKRISDDLSLFADEQARAEGERAGAIAGTEPGYKPTEGGTIRQRAYDKAGNAALMAQQLALFQSDAVDAYQKNRSNPEGFKAAYERLANAYGARLPKELHGDFMTRATTLGTSLRVKVADGFETRQTDQARVAMIQSQDAHRTAMTKLAITDPDGPATMDQARAGLKAQEEQIDGLVAADQLTAVEGEKQKQKLRADTLLTLYAERANRMTDPAAIEQLRRQVRADFVAGKIPLLNADGFASLDTGLDQLSRKRRSELAAQVGAFSKTVDDWIERSSKNLTPPPGEIEALRAEAARIGAPAQTVLALAEQKARVARTIDNASPERAAEFVRELEAQAKQGARHDAIVAPGKTNVDLSTLNQNVRDAAARAGGILGEPLRITSANDSKHADGSQHYAGAAIDIRTRDEDGTPFTPEKRAQVIDALVQAGFTGIHSDGKHIHADMREGAVWRGEVHTAEEAAALDRRRFASGATNIDRGQGAGVTAPQADVITFARARLTERQNLVNRDPLLEAERNGSIPGGRIAPLDWNLPADQVATQMRDRVTQADAVAQANGRPAAYLRPDEKARMSEVMQAGGTKALDMLDGLVRGAGTRAPQLLAEIGDGAPELAHATMLAIQTGDRTLQRRAAAALEARRAPGAHPPKPNGEELDGVMRDEAGGALRGLDGAQRERVRATAALVFEREAAERGIDPKSAAAKTLLTELVQASAGRSRHNGKDYGGFADHRTGGWWGDSVKVLVPPDVRADRFTTALRAMTDADLAALPDPPVDAKGETMKAADLLTFAPRGARGLYRFGNVDPTTNEIVPVRTKSGAIFALNWNAIAPALKSRVPDAFR